MFERFTEQARQVVVLAQDEARTLRHNYIGTEHLLLGLLRFESGVAADALAALGVSLEPVQAQVSRIIGHGDELGTGQIPFTPRSKRVLELALKESQALRHGSIDAEHILLGLARENEGVASRILDDLGADADRVRAAVFAELQLDPGPDYEERMRLAARAGGFPVRMPEGDRARVVAAAFLPGLLALGLGILIGWLIWG